MGHDELPDWDPAAHLPSEFDGFEVAEPLGRGGMGTVYLGRDVMLDRPVALKFIASPAPTARARERFLIEARALARLQHPNVVGIYRIGSVQGHPYVAYELVDGSPLHRVDQPVSWRLALSIALAAARGLAAVHRCGILHRDIKPANMILLADGGVKLLDFGLAKLMDAGDDASGPDSRDPTAPRPARALDLTSAGTLAGTPAYMAPELWRGEPATPQTDIYALGLVLYELLEGGSPWPAIDGERHADVLAREVPRLDARRDDVPGPLLAAITRMTHRDPRDRFRDAGELCAALEEINATFQPFTDPPRDDLSHDEVLLQESFTRVAADADGFAQRFYDRVFAARPELRSLFSNDMTEQRRKLVTTLQLIVRNVQRSELVVPMLLDLGARHAAYGARLEHFEVMGAALLHALAECDRDGWSGELERAWSFAYQRLASTMITGLTQQLERAQEASADATAWTPPVATPRTHYVRRDGVTLAYQLFGSGAMTLVVVPGWVSHLEHAWQEPSFARFLAQLSSRTRVLLVDRRGTGLSDRTTTALSVEHHADDLLAVMDNAKVDKAALFGISDAAPACALLAATAPDRIKALVIYGGAPRMLSAPGAGDGATPETVDMVCATIRQRWGSPLFLDRYARSRADDPRFSGWWAAFLRSGASPTTAEALVRAGAAADVRAALPLIAAPTLLLHRSGDRHVPLELGRQLAAAIPRSSLVELPGEDHLPFSQDPGRVVHEILGFLVDLPTEVGIEDVDQPRLVALLSVSGGDELSREASRRLIVRHRGSVVDQDGAITGMFDRVGRAVHCAAACLERARTHGHTLEIGIELAGITGRLELDPATLQRARRIGATRPGQVVVGSSAATLLAGQDDCPVVTQQ